MTAEPDGQSLGEADAVGWAMVKIARERFEQHRREGAPIAESYLAFLRALAENAAVVDAVGDALQAIADGNR